MRNFIIIIIAAAVVLELITESCFTVSESEYVVKTQFGKPSGIIKDPGFKLKWTGFLETVNRIDRRIHTFTTQPVQVMLGDKNPVVVTSYICWRTQDPLLFFQSLINEDIATQKLGDMINSQVGNTLGDFNLENIINTDSSQIKLSELEKMILDHTNASAKEKYGIEIVKVGIRRIAYPSIVANAVYNRMRSEREKEAKKFRAEGKEEATKIKAAADREVTEILAEAYKQAETLKGEGDKKALKLYTAAYGQDKDFFEFTKSMETYKDILNDKSTIVLSTDSDILQYLNDPMGNKQ